MLSFSDYAGISFEEALGLMIMLQFFFLIMRELVPTTLLTKSLPNAKLLSLTADFSHSKSDSDYFHSTAMPNWPLFDIVKVMN